MYLSLILVHPIPLQTLVPNADAYVREVQLSAELGHIEVRSSPEQGGVFAHQIAGIAKPEAGPHFWWDLNNTLVYRGDIIESVGNADARFLQPKELLKRIELGSDQTVSLVIRSDFAPEDAFGSEDEDDSDDDEHNTFA
jgi:hypothetical protein